MDGQMQLEPNAIIVDNVSDEDVDEDLALELGESGQTFPVIVEMVEGEARAVQGGGIVLAARLWNTANPGRPVTLACEIAKMQPHPLSLLFPPMAKMELAELEEDIKAHGFDQRQPVTVYQGKILDGRHRYAAALAVGVEPIYTQFVGDDGAALDFVLRANLHRRHLTTSQRAAVAAELATLRTGQRPSKEGAGVSQGDAARTLNVSVATVERAAKVKREAPDLHDKVKAGEMTVGKAAEEAKRRRGPYELKDKKKPPPKPPEKSERAKRSEALAKDADAQVQATTSEVAPKLAAKRSPAGPDRPASKFARTAADVRQMMDDPDLGDDDFTWRDFGKWLLGEQEYLVG